MRLDDGSVASLRVEQRDCEWCGPPDCGCFAIDSFWILVVGAGGRVVARIHFWAAYGAFAIIPVDLVGGPGDELMVVRISAHAAPPVGYDVKIIEIVGAKGVERLSSYQVAGTLASLPFACVRWRSRLTVDAEQPKPRSIAVERHLVPPTANCRMDESARVEVRRWRPHVLRFSSGRYRAK